MALAGEHGVAHAFARGERGLEVLLCLLGGRGLEELRVVLFLEEDGYEPIFQP
jgi:hypothetical protein